MTKRNNNRLVDPCAMERRQHQLGGAEGHEGVVSHPGC